MNRFKDKKMMLIVSCLLSLAPLWIGLLLWNRLPQQVPLHFGVNGEPDGYGSKLFFVIVIPVVFLGIHLLCLYVTGKDRKNANNSETIMNLTYWLMPILSVFLSALVYSSTLGNKINAKKTIILALAVIMLLIGNYMPKCRPSSTIGIRVPWTMKDSDVWYRTHRLAGYMSFGFGMLSPLFLLMADNEKTIMVFVGLLLAVTLVPVIYSYLLYSKKN